MASSGWRTAKLQPWYHVTAPRCDTITLAKTQCVMSAYWTDKKTGKIHICSIHAKMADFPVKPIKTEEVYIRQED